MTATDAWRFVLPPGWRRFPAMEHERERLDAEIEASVAGALPETLPRDSAEPWRQRMRAQLRGAVQDAERAGALAVYVPVESVDGYPVPASLIESEITTEPGAQPEHVAAGMLDGPATAVELLEVDGRPAVRVETVRARVESDAGDGETIATSRRQAVYAIRVDDAGGWLVLSFSVAGPEGDPGPLAEALVLLFDAVMSTFRWAGGELEAEPAATA